MKGSAAYKEFMDLPLMDAPKYYSREVLADLDTPLSCYLKMKYRYPSSPSFLLESAEQKERLGRFSVIGFEPFIVFKSKGKKVSISGMIEAEFEVENPYLILKEITKRFKPPSSSERISCFGGAVGYVGYDVVRFFETLPDCNEEAIGVYDMYFMFPARLIIFDNYTRRMTLLSIDIPDASCHDQGPGKNGALAIEEMHKILRSSLPITHQQAFPVGQLKGNLSKGEFEDMVLKAKRYIYAGDIIQVVLSQRFIIELDIDSMSLYRALRVVNPSPYMFLLDYPEYSLIGSSPETMVKQVGLEVEVRPIAGTRPRGETKAEDDELAKELLSDEKELAEHTMLVDLGRNDVGRVSEIGSISLPEFMVIERYSHVMHIVSSVRGQVRPGLDAFDVFQATFPAGTVTGAPKIRAMEIIDELEKEKREFYAGAVGYFSYNGDMDFCITIRSLLKRGNKVYIQAGAGIVADSVPEKEYVETIHKSEAIVKAITELKEIIS